jgi:hypothetical protein
LQASNEGVPKLEQHVSEWTLLDFNATGRLERHWLWTGGVESQAQHIVLLRPLAAGRGPG